MLIPPTSRYLNIYDLHWLWMIITPTGRPGHRPWPINVATSHSVLRGIQSCLPPSNWLLKPVKSNLLEESRMFRPRQLIRRRWRPQTVVRSSGKLTSHGYVSDWQWPGRVSVTGEGVSQTEQQTGDYLRFGTNLYHQLVRLLFTKLESSPFSNTSCMWPN